MLDTTVFNHLLDGGIDPARIPAGRRLVVTRVQWNQITRTTDPQRSAGLIDVFATSDPQFLEPSTPAWYEGDSEGGLYKPLLAKLIERDKKNKKKLGPGTRADARIAETAILRHLVLVRDDGGLADVTREAGGIVMNLDEFLSS